MSSCPVFHLGGNLSFTAHGAKAGLGKSPPLEERNQLQRPSPSQAQGLCSGWISVTPGGVARGRPQPAFRAGFSGSTVSVAFLLFFSASGSRFLQGAVARMAGRMSCSWPWLARPAAPGRRRRNIQCDVNVPWGWGRGGVRADHSSSPSVSCAPCSPPGPPTEARRVWTRVRPCQGGPTCWTGKRWLPGEREWVPVLPLVPSPARPMGRHDDRVPLVLDARLWVAPRTVTATP